MNYHFKEKNISLKFLPKRKFIFTPAALYKLLWEEGVQQISDRHPSLAIPFRGIADLWGRNGAYTREK